MKVSISHPTGNSFFRWAAMGFLNADILSGIYTTIAVFPGDTSDKLSDISLLGELKRRSYDAKLKPYTHTSPFYEAGRIISLKAGLNSLTKHETGYFSVDSVYNHLDKHVANNLKSKKGTDTIYAYEDGALNSFIKAKQLGIKCMYDLPIGYWRTARRLMESERERWPDWMPTLTGFMDSEEKLLRKDEELKLADKIFVASKFTADTLSEFPGSLAPIEIIPYGFPKVGAKREYPSFNSKRKLKLLFVGGLSQRKGIADLFAVAEQLKEHVELTVVGKKATDNCPALNIALSKHKWIPSLHIEDVLKLMREQDVLVFPSLFEGFGMVITEAMSQGTPVITTDRTAGPDLITHGDNGWLIEAASTIALKNAIEELLANPSIIAKAGNLAMEAARLRPWETYGSELATCVMK